MTPPDESHQMDAARHGGQGALGWGGEIGGLLLLVLGIVFMVGGWELGLGVPTRLGTGAFPFISGAIVSVLSIVVCIQERRGDGIAERPDWVAFTITKSPCTRAICSMNRWTPGKKSMHRRQAGCHRSLRASSSACGTISTSGNSSRKRRFPISPCFS